MLIVRSICGVCPRGDSRNGTHLSAVAGNEQIDVYEALGTGPGETKCLANISDYSSHMCEQIPSWSLSFPCHRWGKGVRDTEAESHKLVSDSAGLKPKLNATFIFTSFILCLHDNSIHSIL